MRQGFYSYLIILFMLTVQGCSSLDEVEVFSAEDGGPRIDQVAGKSDVLAIFNPKTNIIYIDPENQERFFTEFHVSNINNQRYIRQFGKQIPIQLKGLSEADYTEKVLGMSLWLHGRKCELKEDRACINTVGQDTEKSFKLNGRMALCMKPRDKTCFAHFESMIQSFYPEKGCKGVPAFSSVVVPTCDPVNNPC